MTQLAHPSKWWRRIDEDTRVWLRENPGEALPADVILDISEEFLDSAAPRGSERHVTLSEEDWDWIKAHG